MILSYVKQDCLEILKLCIVLFGIIPSTLGIDATLSLKVDGNGYHRSLIYQVGINDFERDNCHVALYLQLPSALYVNIDELADLRRSGITIACSTGETDVELFAEKAKPQNVTTCTRFINNTAVLKFPIHERYQYAKEGGGYNMVILPKPNLLIGCPDRIKEHRVSRINLCSECASILPKWREIPYTMDQEDCIWLIPVGDSSLLTLVSSVTLFTTILGAIFIARTICKSTLEESHKKD